MGPLLEKFTMFFDHEELKYRVDEEKSVITSGFSGKHGEYRVLCRTIEDKDLLTCYTYYPCHVQEEKRDRAAEFLTRANYGMRLGNFEMDFSDGEVRYKTCIDVEDIEINLTFVKNFILPNIITADRYFPGMMKLLYGGVTAEQAINEIEG
jgi:hypothetical protein